MQILEKFSAILTAAQAVFPVSLKTGAPNEDIVQNHLT